MSQTLLTPFGGHGIAAHLLGDSNHIRSLQELLGHLDVITTMISIRDLISPPDSMTKSPS